MYTYSRCLLERGDADDLTSSVAGSQWSDSLGIVCGFAPLAAQCQWWMVSEWP